jgi:hypothetical protein
MRSTDGAFALLFTLDLNIPLPAVLFSLYFWFLRKFQDEREKP